MKTRFLVVTLIFLGHGKIAKGEKTFECPVKCSTDAYRPICVRGKSYANLCVLQQNICNGKTARELYNDVEACPGYEKDEDAAGASVEAIDKNGVIFRNFIDTPTRGKILFPSQAAKVPAAKSIACSTKKRRKGRQGKRMKRILICRQTCSTHEAKRRPACFPGVPRLCGIEFLVRRCCMRSSKDFLSGPRRHLTARHRERANTNRNK